jgi:nitroreductase
MDLYEALLTTRAMRRYSDEPVTRAEVEHCLRAANQAPSGGNIQPWQFLVVTSADRRAALGAIYRKAYDRYERVLLASMGAFRSPEDEASWNRTMAASRHLAEHLGEAPVLALFLMPDISMTLSDDEGDLDVGTPYASIYPAVQSFLLAARGLGIGTALTTVYRIHQDEVRAACGIPDQLQVVAMVPMGRPTGKFGMARRKPVEKVTHWETFGTREPFETPAPDLSTGA